MQNNLPTTKQALELIKQALDNAAQKGVYPNLETGYSVSIAYNVLNNALDEKQNEKSLPNIDNKD